jgi:hypothetical protein
MFYVDDGMVAACNDGGADALVDVSAPIFIPGWRAFSSVSLCNNAIAPIL